MTGFFYFETSKFHHTFGQNKLVFCQNEIKVLDGISKGKWKLQMTLKVRIRTLIWKAPNTTQKDSDLMIRFRKPTTAVVHSEDVFNFVGKFNLSIITDKFAHSSPKSDIVFQSIDKLR